MTLRWLSLSLLAAVIKSFRQVFKFATQTLGPRVFLELP
jgi:hypothetical protein